MPLRDLDDSQFDENSKIGRGIRQALDGLDPELWESRPLVVPEPHFVAESRRVAAEKAAERRRQEEVDERERRLEKLAIAAEERERRRERRERWLFWIAIAGLIFSIIAAVTGTIAIA